MDEIIDEIFGKLSDEINKAKKRRGISEMRCFFNGVKT